MAENSRKKTLPLAVLAAPALAFGSVTFAAAPAMAVPVEDVQAILDEDGIDTALLVAPEEIQPVSDEDGAEPIAEGELVVVDAVNAGAETFVAENGGTYLLEPFEHATADQYEEQNLSVPSFIEQDEGDDGDADRVSPEITLDPTEAQVDETVRITIENADEVLASYDYEDYSIEVNGDVRTGESYGLFGDAGIEPVDGEDAYEFTIPDSVETDSGEIPVEADSSFTFRVTFIINSDVAGDRVDTYSNLVTLNISGESTPDPTDPTETPDPETPTPTPTEPTPTETNDPGIQAEPSLTLGQDEILLEDFIGESEEGTGVLHTVEGLEPGTAVEYTVETPTNVQTYESSGEANEEGILKFWIHGYETGNASVYVGDYFTTVTFDNADDETQELTAEFTVVDGTEDNGTGDQNDTEGTGEEDEDITPVVDTDEDASEEDETPALGSADELAETGSSGAPLAWIAGGLLALGGAFVLYANRARLFGRKH